MEKPTTMRIFLTGPNPSLLVAPGRISQVVWEWVQANHSDHVGAFFGLPQDQVVGRMLPLARGAAAAVNFGALCETAKPDVVISVGDDGDAAHVAATLMVGLAQFKWIHVLVDQERHQRRPYDSIPDADVVLAVGSHAASQAADSGCRNVVQVSPVSPILAGFSSCDGLSPNRYFLTVAKNFETSNLFYLRDEWVASGLGNDGWELLVASNGADPGDFDMPSHALPVGMRHIWSASSLTYGVPDEDMVDMMKFSWALVDCSLNPATCLLAAEAAHMGVGTVATDSLPYRNAGVCDLLPSTSLKSASGRTLRVPQEGVLADKLIKCTVDRPKCAVKFAPDLVEQLFIQIVGRKEGSLKVEVVRPS